MTNGKENQLKSNQIFMHDRSTRKTLKLHQKNNKNKYSEITTKNNN